MGLTAGRLAAGALLLLAGPVRAEPAWTQELVLQGPSHPAPPGRPHVVVHAPQGWDPRPPVDLVVLLHGWSCCASSMVGVTPCGPDDPSRRGWGLGAVHDRAGTNTLLVTPQLAFLARTSSPGRFAEPGFFRAYLDEVLASAPRLGAGRPRPIGSITLVAHSAGYQSALAILTAGGREVDNVVLLDAMYAGADTFAAWASRGTSSRPRRFVSLYTRVRGTTRGSRDVAERLRALLGRGRVAVDPGGSLRAALATHAAVIARSPVGHGAVPAQHLAELLGGLGLPDRAGDVRDSSHSPH